jgi:phosphoribosylanthranilate isomerase
MKIKVCGMRDASNIKELEKLAPDYMGFIFYPGSKRYAHGLDRNIVGGLKPKIKKTGVFVDAMVSDVLERIADYKLDAVQLHGNETPEICAQMRRGGVEVIKAFGIDDSFDFNDLNAYHDAVDYFLFDTKTATYGGSGKTFDWALLKRYRLNKPYFLSGGLNPLNIGELNSLSDERFYAIDVNSGFEDAPGMKNIKELRKAINLFRTNEQQFE